jgi:hypothetical protein
MVVWSKKYLMVHMEVMVQEGNIYKDDNYLI